MTQGRLIATMEHKARTVAVFLFLFFFLLGCACAKHSGKELPRLHRVCPLEPENQYYRHGGFIGAVVPFLRDDRWRYIMNELMPDVYADIASRLGSVPSSSIAHMLENNPVLSAFGAWASSRADESDAHVLPEVQDFTCDTMEALLSDKMRTRQPEDRRRTDSGGDGDESPFVSVMFEWDVFVSDNVASVWKLAQSNDDTRDADHLSCVESDERDECTAGHGGHRQIISLLVDRMLIAHGSMLQLVGEFGGFSQYSAVEASRPTQMGGVSASRWMDAFAKALEMIEDMEREACVHPAPVDDAVFARPPKGKYTCTTSRDKSALWGERVSSTSKLSSGRRSFEDAVEIFRRVTGIPEFSVVLDLKSGQVDPVLLTAIVAELNRRGVVVDAVGSFKIAQILGVRAAVQQRGGQRVRMRSLDKVTGGRRLSVVSRDAPRELWFFHFVSDVLYAASQRLIPRGASVLFNGGSVVGYRKVAFSEAKLRSYHIKEDSIERLRKAKEIHGFSVGIYVQEFDCDAKATAMINHVINREARLFDLGFAWGGLAGLVGSDIRPSIIDGTVGTAEQGLIARSREPLGFE